MGRNKTSKAYQTDLGLLIRPRSATPKRCGQRASVGMENKRFEEHRLHRRSGMVVCPL